MYEMFTHVHFILGLFDVCYSVYVIYQPLYTIDGHKSIGRQANSLHHETHTRHGILHRFQDFNESRITFQFRLCRKSARQNY